MVPAVQEVWERPAPQLPERAGARPPGAVLVGTPSLLVGMSSLPVGTFWAGQAVGTFWAGQAVGPTVPLFVWLSGFWDLSSPTRG